MTNAVGLHKAPSFIGPSPLILRRLFMIGTAISYIRKRVDDHLRKVNQDDADGSSRPMAELVDGSQLDPLVLSLGTVSLLVVDVSEDREFRDADRFQRRIITEDSINLENHYPDLHLEIGLLFIAKYKDYGRAWNQLSHVIGFFQHHPSFDTSKDTDLPEGIGRLVADLSPQSLKQTSELWSAFRIAPHPAVLYRFRLLTMAGPLFAEQPKLIKTVQTEFTPQPHSLNLRSPPLVETRSN
ncbi:MAG: Pvc16 family protein [Synechococcaceae cyanobacterium]